MSLFALQLLPATVRVVLMMLGAAVLFSLIRLIRGPTLPDRVVALDLIVTTAVGAIAVFSVAMENPVFLIVAISLALIAFLGTIAFAYYVEKGGES